MRTNQQWQAAQVSLVSRYLLTSIQIISLYVTDYQGEGVALPVKACGSVHAIKRAADCTRAVTL